MSQRNSQARRERRRLRKERKRQRYLSLGYTPKVRRKKTMNRHHLLNKCQGGTWDVHNILWIYISKHQIWHALFKNLDLDQVIDLLQRVKLAKEHQIEEHPR